MPSRPQLSLQAHAKINLALAVGPPADNGMHPIASWMHAIDLADDVTLEQLGPRSKSKLEIRWADDAPRPTPIDWDDRIDLAARAHMLLEKHVERTLPLRITLTKRIPTGAGLGGGSADAAATLVGINRLFDLGLGLAQLQSLSTSIGSDVAFFIDDRQPPRPSLVTGFADTLERLTPVDRPILLVIPAGPCHTREVYQTFDTLPPLPLDESRVRQLIDAPPDPNTLFNDLAPAAELVRPELVDIRRVASEALSMPVNLTGSGSALFAIADAGAAHNLVAALEEAELDVVVTPARLVGPDDKVE